VSNIESRRCIPTRPNHRIIRGTSVLAAAKCYCDIPIFEFTANIDWNGMIQGNSGRNVLPAQTVRLPQPLYRRHVRRKFPFHVSCRCMTEHRIGEWAISRYAAVIKFRIHRITERPRWTTFSRSKFSRRWYARFRSSSVYYIKCIYVLRFKYK